MFLLAQIGGYSIAQLAILVVVIAAIAGLVLVGIRQFGISIPAWFQQVVWIVIAAFVIIIAIRLVSGF